MRGITSSAISDLGVEFYKYLYHESESWHLKVAGLQFDVLTFVWGGCWSVEKTFCQGRSSTSSEKHESLHVHRDSQKHFFS